MKAERLLSLLLTLQIRKRVTAKELAQQFEVSERTIYRDIVALSLAGAPVFCERGPHGGCGILPNYRTTVPSMTIQEIRTIFPSGMPQILSALGMDDVMERATLKLQAALPDAQRLDAEHTRQRLHIDPVGWNHTQESTPQIDAVQAAVWNERKLRMVYRRSDGSVNERVVEPLGLVAKAGIWYLIGKGDGSIRVFRVGRILKANVLDEPCIRPEGFDLATFWRESCAQFRATLPRYPVTVRIAPALVPFLAQTFGEEVARQIADIPRDSSSEWKTVSLVFESYEAARSRIMSVGARIEIVEPVELRAGIIAMVTEIRDFYLKRL
jgi:predicted DNA-binding transcriptional regulator YafY